MTSVKQKVNACRPGFGASCALCCGSHNCRASIDEMAALYRARGAVAALYSRDYLVGRVMASRSPMTGSYCFIGKHDPAMPSLPPLFEKGARCPFVGFRDNDGLIGCLLHGPGDPSLRYDCFLNYSSKSFTCAARENLADGEIIFAAELFRDWYYYSLLIHAPGALKRVMADHAEPQSVDPDALLSLREELSRAARHRDALHFMTSYF